jgi:hypothetical protein
MLCGRCCVTEPPTKLALQLGIFIEILPQCWVNKGKKRRAGVLCPGPSYVVGLRSPNPSRPSAAALLWHHRGTARCGR